MTFDLSNFPSTARPLAYNWRTALPDCSFNGFGFPPRIRLPRGFAVGGEALPRSAANRRASGCQKRLARLGGTWGGCGKESFMHPSLRGGLLSWRGSCEQSQFLRVPLLILL